MRQMNQKWNKVQIKAVMYVKDNYVCLIGNGKEMKRNAGVRFDYLHKQPQQNSSFQLIYKCVIPYKFSCCLLLLSCKDPQRFLDEVESNARKTHTGITRTFLPCPTSSLDSNK